MQGLIGFSSVGTVARLARCFEADIEALASGKSRHPEDLDTSIRLWRTLRIPVFAWSEPAEHMSIGAGGDSNR